MIKKVLLIFVLVISANSKTLKDLAKEVIVLNPEVNEALEHYRVSLKELKKAKAGHYPTIEVSGEVGKEYTESPGSFLSDSTNVMKADTDNLGLDIPVVVVGRLNLFSGFRIQNLIKEKERAIESASNRLFEKATKITNSIVQSYLDILRKKELLKISDDNIKIHKDILNKVERRLLAGVGYESEQHHTKSRLNLAQLNKIIASKKYQNAIIKYKKAIYNLPYSYKDIDFELDNLTLKDEDIQLNRAKENNFNIKSKRVEIDVAKHIYKQQKSKYYPTIDLEVSRIWNENIYGLEYIDSSYKAAIVFKWNLYNGGADEASRVSSLYNIHKNIENLDNEKLMLEEKVKMLLLEYKLLQEQYKVIDMQLANIKKTKELYEKEFQNNKRTLVDLLNIRQDYNNAMKQKIDTKYDRLQILFNIKASTGDIVKYFELEELLNSNMLSDRKEMKKYKKYKKGISEDLKLEEILNGSILF